jgi:hypothetical protein
MHWTHFSVGRQKGAILIVVAALGLMASPAAWAKRRPPPGDVSAIDAYRESIPTAKGSKATGSGSTRGVVLPVSVASRLGTDRTGRLLKRVATSPTLGAVRVRRGRAGPRARLKTWSIPKGISAAGNGIGDSAGRLVALIVALVVITVGAVGGAALNRRA